MKKIFKNIWGWIINLLKIIMGFLSLGLTMAKKVFKKVFGTVVVLSFLVVPFLNNGINHSIAHWLWYPAMILIVISFVVDWLNKLKPVCDSPTVEFARKWGEALLLFAMISVFVINYYAIDKIWLWIIFAYVALYTPFFFLSLLVFDIKQTGKDAERHQKAFANIVKNIALYWFVDLFYMSVFNYWVVYTETQVFNTTWLWLQFIFGILSLVIITFNLVQVFLNGEKSLWFFMALELVIALITCGYLIFIIPDEDIQKIVLTIVSALLGGILTLVGVAWTIKDTNEKRQKDLERIENERKEEERKKYVPFVNFFTDINSKVDHTITVSKIDLPCSRKKKCYILEPWFLKNTDFSCFYISEVLINNYLIHINPYSFIDKKWVVRIKFKHCFVLSENIEYLGIQIKDMLGNNYRVTLDFETIRCDSGIIKIRGKGCYSSVLVEPVSN